jgi:hypothetical protein
MIEFLKHFFGVCGEHWHPNIWNLLASGFGITTIFSYLRYRYKTKFTTPKNKK